MLIEEVSGEGVRDAEAVKEFFNQWSVYHRIVENDYLYHRSVKSALVRLLDDLGRPFSFLDLGCGDAAFSADFLKGRAVTSYTGIDLSNVALDFAAENIGKIGIPHSLHCGDFMTLIASIPEAHDIIYIGLSLHHLAREEKKFLFGELRHRISRDGALLIFDPVLTPGETREHYLGRWTDHAIWSWQSLTSEEVDRAVQHVVTADFPEDLTTLNRMALNAGFQPAKILFMDRTDFYALMAFQPRQLSE